MILASENEECLSRLIKTANTIGRRPVGVHCIVHKESGTG